jgi:hypothetical protein
MNKQNKVHTQEAAYHFKAAQIIFYYFYKWEYKTRKVINLTKNGCPVCQDGQISEDNHQHREQPENFESPFHLLE